MLKLLSQIKTRLSNRSDTEHETAIIRLVVGTAAGVTLLVHWQDIVERGDHVALICGLIAFYFVAIGILAHICAYPEQSPRRRYLGIIADISFVTVTLLVGQTSSTQGLVSIYLWITLANGLRFGPRYLLFALALSVGGFIGAMIHNPFWDTHIWLGFELLLGQILVSIYAWMLVRKLHRAMEQEAAANAAKRTFVSRMSHEMRTPLNSIVGMADVTLADPELKPNHKRNLIILRESSQHLANLVDDVLDFSKIEAGKFNLNIERVDLRELVWTCAKIMEPQARSKNLNFDIHIDRRTPKFVQADAVRLRQVLINLAGNAIKFTASGYVKIGVEALPSSTTDARLEFSVRDTGIGIPADKIEKIFESFTQADESVTRTYGGTGLGVTISQNLVQLMGGKIEVDSRVNEGSVFKFVLVLPIAKESQGTDEGNTNMWATIGFGQTERQQFEELATPWGVELAHHADMRTLTKAVSDSAYRGAIVLGEDIESFHSAHDLGISYSIPVVFLSADDRLLDQAPASACAKLKWPCNRFDLFHALHFDGEDAKQAQLHVNEVAAALDPATRGLRVLVVDDMRTNLETIAAILGSAGHSCEITESPETAMDWCAADKFDLLICDRNMPTMDGVDLVREIRSQEAVSGERIAIAMLTGDATEETRKIAVAAGVDTFLRKPIRRADLLASIEALQIHAPAPPKPAARGNGRGVAAPHTPEVLAAPLIDEEIVNELSVLKPDDPLFVLNLQKRFLDDAAGWILQIEGALNDGSIEPIKEAVHAIEGSSGSVGLMAINRLCTEYHGLESIELTTRAQQFAERLPKYLNLTADAIAAAEAATNNQA